MKILIQFQASEPKQVQTRAEGQNEETFRFTVTKIFTLNVET